jgi:hypothetical protein
MIKILEEIPPERREKILARADQLIREERRGRFAPDRNQDTADAADRRASIVLGVMLAACAVVAIAIFFIGKPWIQ